jgi:Fe-S cluster assembly ATP-binding protein
MLLRIKRLTVSAGNKSILQDISLAVKAGQICALTGPNGSGKTSLAHAIMGDPELKIESGSIEFEGRNIIALKPEERNRLGIFLSFQEPPEVGGVAMNMFLRTIAKKRKKNMPADKPIKNRANNTTDYYRSILPSLGLSESFLFRELNRGFSGGEKKKSELLQMLALKPKLAIIDEIDSGLDAASVKTVCRELKKAAKGGMGLIVISHYKGVYETLDPDLVYVLSGGRPNKKSYAAA